MANRILVVTQQGEARFLTTESVPTRVITIQPTGARGNVGATGAGVAAGGFANDILKKTSATDYETEWETPTSLATPETIVRRDETGGVFFGGDVGAPKYRGSFYQASSSTEGASLTNSAGTAYLTWGKPTGNISITVDTTSDGHFYSAPITATAGHFVTKNGTAPTIVAGRSAWFSNATGDPQFRNGTGSAVTLIYNGGALGTPSALVVTNATGTASININGTVGATTANTGAFTTITASSTITGATHNGGTAANDDLTLQGTTNATRTTSYVLIQPNGGFTGIGTSSPALPLHIVNSNANAGMFRVQNTSASGYTGFELYGDAGTQLAAFGTGNSTAAFYPGEMYLGTNTAKAVNIYTTNASSVRMYISAAGGVSIGNTTDAGATNLSVTGRITGTAGIVYGTFTVSTFPSTTYLEAVVTDALAPVVGATVAAGGSAKCKVMYNGSAKIVTAVL